MTQMEKINFNKMIYERKENAGAKLGVGIFLHLTSIIFVDKKYRTPYLNSPFGVINNTAVFFDVMAVVDFIKIKKLKKKHKI